MKKSTVAVMMIAALSGTTYAESIQLSPNFSAESFTVSTSAGMLSGKSQERVYDADTGRKVSQLDWKIKNVAIVKGDISWDAYSFLTLTARGWTSMASGSGHMDDYDWMNDNQSGWTDHSSHPSTNVNYANEYDLSVQGWIFQDENYKAGVIAGYQETRFSWTATGGSTIMITVRRLAIFQPASEVLGTASDSPCPTLVWRVSIVSTTLNLMPCLSSVIGSELMIMTNTICVS